MAKISDVEVVRLKAIANMLDDVQESAFDLEQWVKQMPKPARARFFGLIETKPACGFAGCAIGWAAYTKLIPGLTMTNSVIDGFFIQPKYKVDDQVYYGFGAVAMALGISVRLAEYLFYSSSYKVHATTEMVATRIRRLVAKVEAIRARERKVTQKELPQSLKQLIDA